MKTDKFFLMVYKCSVAGHSKIDNQHPVPCCHPTRSDANAWYIRGTLADQQSVFNTRSSELTRHSLSRVNFGKLREQRRNPDVEGCMHASGVTYDLCRSTTGYRYLVRSRVHAEHFRPPFMSVQNSVFICKKIVPTRGFTNWD